MEEVVARVKRILMAPREALTLIKDEPLDIALTMKEYVAILAAIPAGATFIGLFGRVPFFRNLIYSLLVYAISAAMVPISGKIIDALAPHFNSTRNDLAAFKVALFMFTPALVAGIFTINPSLSILWLLGSLYGIYLMYLALPVLMETPEDKRLLYTAVNAVIIYIVSVILIRIVSAIALGYWSDSFR